MHTSRKPLAAVLAATIVATGALANSNPALAQSYNNGYGGNGNSGGYAGVANISVANGYVAIVRGDSGAQVGATINAPVVPGDYVATGSNSNAEIQFDGISMLRLASNTQVRIVNLVPNAREVQLASGTVGLAEEQGADGNPQIDTPSLTLRPTQSGDYRVSVLGNGQTLVTVRSGAATVSTGYGSDTVTPGSTLVANGSSIQAENPVGFDSFDQFNISRDQLVASSYNANPYVSPQLAGYSNFANYGQWQNVPGYGEAWAPNNQSQTNFAPYQNGQWVWEPGSGYTWVDNAPYGYATSHYGSWFNKQQYGGWLWQPPANQYQSSSSSLASSWLPAAVAFFLSGSNGGGGGGLGSILGLFGGSSGFSGNGNSGNSNIGWIPLAPGEQYQQQWSGQNASYQPTTVTNITNITNIYNYYGNARVRNAVSIMPVNAWRSGTFSRRVVAQASQLKQIAFIHGAIPIVPTASNLRYVRSTTAIRPVVLSHTFTAPRLVSRAPVVSRLLFAKQQAQIKTLATTRPKVVVLTKPVTHAVYTPVVRTPIHLVAIKPVTPLLPRTTHLVAPGVRPLQTTKPIVTTLRTTAPLLAKPLHTAVPTAKPVVHVKTPESAPVHTATPSPLRVPTPIVHPALHTPEPVIKTPPFHPSPTPKPMPVATPKPVHLATPIPAPVHVATPTAKPTVLHVAPVIPQVRTPIPVRPSPLRTAPVAPPTHLATPIVKPVPVVKPEPKVKPSAASPGPSDSAH